MPGTTIPEVQNVNAWEAKERPARAGDQFPTVELDCYKDCKGVSNLARTRMASGTTNVWNGRKEQDGVWEAAEIGPC